MKIISWNVNGIRAAMRNGFSENFKNINADVLCLQETKAHPVQVELNLPEYFQFWNTAQKRGYSGTVLFTKIPPLRVWNGMNIDAHDTEGRLITAEYPDFFLVNVYTPNAQRDLRRLEYRTENWDIDFLKYLKLLDSVKPVIFCGDLNVAHREIDLANPASNRRNAGFTDEERERIDILFKAGFIDTFRQFVTEGGHYSWWSYRLNARARNIGWRIDYVGISERLKPRLKNAFILNEVYGSDHCPVGIVLNRSR